MSNYPGIHPIWNIEPTPSQFSQLPDDDFLALLEKQFPRSMQHELTLSKDGDANINPQSINRLSLPGVSPPSDESSPSPSSNNTDPLSRRQSQSTSSRPGDNADESMALKRKASDDDLVEGPSSKSKHAADESGTKKGQPTKRKSTGNPQDESRLLKRKEQNRAAQRAFRERKEKHVKDLEDKVADLEAKNEEAQAENNNLRDLLARLQEENMTLKQSQFTFSVPKPGSSSTPVPPSTNASTSSSLPPASPLSFFGGPGPVTPLGADIDWSALTTFDPAMLNMLDEPPISDVPMQPQSQHQQADFSSSPYGQYALPPPNQYRTIANNPWLMSFADTPDTTSATTVASPVNISGANGLGMFDTFGFNNFGPAVSSSNAPWAPPPTHTPPTFGQQLVHASNGLEELFSSNFLSPGTGSRQNSGSLDFGSAFAENGPSPLSISPVSHANGGANTNKNAKESAPSPPASTQPAQRSNSLSSSMKTVTLSPSDTSACADAADASATCGNSSEGGELTVESLGLPRRFTREELAKHIAACGESPFTAATSSNVTASTGCSPSESGTENGQPKMLHKASDFTQGHIIACHGSGMPKTQESPENIEVLKAWRTITSNPHFKDTDINELCSEFSKKARCDGTKVVLEPEGVQHIIETLTMKKQQQCLQNVQMLVQQGQQHTQQLQHQLQGQL